MTSTQSGGQILKADTLARMRTPSDRKEQLLEEFERSGLTGAKFAALVGVKYSTFAAWAAKRRRSGTATPPAKTTDGASKVRWLEAVIDQADESNLRSASTLTLQLIGGARTEIADFKQIPLAAALLRALDKSAGC